MDWFERLTGFRETGYAETQGKLRLEGRKLQSLINGKSYGIGELELVSLQALRERAKSAGGLPGRLKVGVVAALELLDVVEKERERVVDMHRSEMAVFRIGMETKNPRKKLRRCLLVAGGHDGVVQGDGHRKTSRYQLPRTCRRVPDNYTLRGRGVQRLRRTAGLHRG